MKKLLLLLLLATAASAQVTLGPFPYSLTSSLQTSGTTIAYPVVTVTGNGTASFPTGSVGAITCSVTGTYTVATTSLNVSNNKTNNLTPLTAVPVNGNSSAFNITANGLYTMTMPPGSTWVQVQNTGTFTGTSQIFTCTGSLAFSLEYISSGDPCQDRLVQKNSLPVTGTAPSTIVAIPNIAGKTTYVCDFSIVTGTAATSVTVSAGTGTTCGTGNIALTGAMPITVGQQLFFGWGGTVFGAGRIPASNDVCVAVAGGTAVYAGYATFVQR